MNNPETLAVERPTLSGIYFPENVIEAYSRTVFMHISLEGKPKSEQLCFKFSFKKKIFQIISKNNFQNISSQIRAKPFKIAIYYILVQ